jgi:putative transposase
MRHRGYPTDLTDSEWRRLEPLLPRPRVIGRPRMVCLREVCNAIRYVLHKGCRWRDLPEDLPPWYTAYSYYRLWEQDGTLDRISASLQCPLPAGADHEPSTVRQASMASR